MQISQFKKIVLTTQASVVAMVICVIGIMLTLYCNLLFYIDSHRLLNSMPTQHHVSAIGSYHLFGMAEISIPTANIHLKLTGLIGNNQQSQAFIELPTGAEKVFKQGETIISGVTLEKILADHIIIKVNGDLEKLNLPTQPFNLSPAPEGWPQ